MEASPSVVPHALLGTRGRDGAVPSSRSGVTIHCLSIWVHPLVGPSHLTLTSFMEIKRRPCVSKKPQSQLCSSSHLRWQTSLQPCAICRAGAYRRRHNILDQRSSSQASFVSARLSIHSLSIN